MRKLTSRFLALALIPCVAMNARAEDDQDDQPQQLASFSQDHKQIVVQSPGVKDFSFGTAVRVMVDGQHMSISSDLDEVQSVSEWRDLETPMGTAMAKSVTYQKPGGEFAYTITLKLLKESKTIALDGVFHNRSSKNVNLNYIELISKDSGLDVMKYTSADELRNDIRKKGIEFEGIASMGLTTLIDNLYKKVSRPKIIQPTILFNYPKILQPLARVNDGDTNLVDQFQLVVNGWEIIKAYSELVDPIDQRERFMEQSSARSEG
ncbi:MAG: amino acid--tRNA ligase-related protein, partial [Oligoflexus sp.]